MLGQKSILGNRCLASIKIKYGTYVFFDHMKSSTDVGSQEKGEVGGMGR